MITSEFISGIRENQIGSSTNRVLLNLNAYGSRYRIDDIAIRVVDNLTKLQQAISISLGLSGSQQVIYIPVNNSSTPVRVVDSRLIDVVDAQGTNQGAYYLYSILTANQRVVVNNPNSIYTSNVLIESPVGGNNQILQDYDVLSGNVQASRESQFRVESDRSYRTATSNTNPVNMYSIVNNIAIPAKVQDSNYTATGWSNARYNGSRINTTTNFGTEPFLQGTFFEGAFFGKDITDTYILSVTDSQYSQYFYSGKLDSLQYTLEDLNIHVSETGSKSLTITASLLTNSTPQTPPLFVGDLFRILEITGSELSGRTFSQEIFQMIAPTGSQQNYPYINQQPLGNDYLWYMQIKNNYDSTPTTRWRTKIFSVTHYFHDLYRIVPTRIYSIQGTTIQPTDQGKIKIKGTDTIVYINNDGYVLSGSNAPGSTFPNII